MIENKHIVADEAKYTEYQNCLMLANGPECIVSKKDFRKRLKQSKALFGVRTIQFDCPYQTEWWSCIRDFDYDIMRLNSKSRYNINYGKRYAYAKEIDPQKYVVEIWEILRLKFEEYPVSYKPTIVPKEKFIVNNDGGGVYFGLFSKDDDKLIGFAVCTILGEMIGYSQSSVMPKHMKNNENYVLVDFILSYFFDGSKKYKYINDGARNIKHQTNMQKYLCSVFGFRYAYSVIKMEYKLLARIAVFCLYPFRNILKKRNNKLVYNVGCLLKMHEYSKKSIKTYKKQILRTRSLSLL